MERGPDRHNYHWELSTMNLEEAEFGGFEIKNEIANFKLGKLFSSEILSVKIHNVTH